MVGVQTFINKALQSPKKVEEGTLREVATAVAVGRRICKEKQGGFVGFKRRVKFIILEK